MKKPVKYILLTLSVIFLGILYYVFLHQSDLRTEIVKKNPQPVEGRALLMKMATAHKIHLWDSVNTYTVAFQDEFFGKIGEQSHPYSSSRMEMILDYIPNTYNGRMSFEDGSSWGIQAWKTYVRQSGGQAVFKDDDDIYFWLPTYQYFIELPNRIQSATAVSYAGEKEIRGRLCKGIFASWDKYKPQSDIDQYLIWIDAETHIIQQMSYTIRDMFDFMTGTINYIDYQEFNGLPLPTRMPVDAIIGEGLLHRMGINGVTFDMIPKEDILPDPNLPYVGDAKEHQMD